MLRGTAQRLRWLEQEGVGEGDDPTDSGVGRQAEELDSVPKVTRSHGMVRGRGVAWSKCVSEAWLWIQSGSKFQGLEREWSQTSPCFQHLLGV